MAPLTAAKRNALAKSSFVFPGRRAYPINDASHARNALARASGKPEEAAVKAAVRNRYPGIDVGNFPTTAGAKTAAAMRKLPRQSAAATSEAAKRPTAGVQDATSAAGRAPKAAPQTGSVAGRLPIGSPQKKGAPSEGHPGMVTAKGKKGRS